MDASRAEMELSRTAEAPRRRAGLYHFLELALAHPGEDGFDCFRREDVEAEVLDLLAALPEGEEMSAGAAPHARAFFAGLRGATFEEIEAAHIALFSVNYPRVPCPPYGSIYTAPDEAKRLERMLAIKRFYQANGVDVADGFDELPDHICAEIEFMKLLCVREAEASERGAAAMVTRVREVQAAFLDAFFLPFVVRLADAAAAAAPERPHTRLLALASEVARRHRGGLARQPGSP